MKIDQISNHSLMKVDKLDEKKDKYPSFANVMKESLQKVNSLQHAANKAGEDLALGKAENIHEVMITAQKAKLSLDLTTTITKKAIDAYKEVMRIQV
ncbi:flagellar hook-basal body complex protein FliE [Orenia marismortui]|uniref:flagellar hook-basal body complex protein FliE n=1 Tax=Orenia marismortui TaxID=46469 RepID=UPI00035EF9C5|nr:flagellar hook-basal body complex protein FliE [Orenia marismortui]